MQLSMVVVACLLAVEVPADAPLQPVAQPLPGADADTAVPAAGEDVKTPANSPPAGPPPVRIPPVRRRLTPPEMVVEALASTPGSRLTGRPLSLLTALSSSADHRHQLEVTHAYWGLAEAVAVYHFSLEHDRQLRGLEAAAEEAVLLQAARASSAALVREAEVAAVAAQHELAALVLFPPDAPLPLPADRPHVGPYRTHFDRLFSARTAPARTRLIDRTLPIRCRAIDGRASAVHATEDATTAAGDARQAGQADLRTLLACMDEHLRQRQAFIKSVFRYNHEIADYALAVIRPGSNVQILVGMLISPTSQPLRPLAADTDGLLQPAGYNEPVPTPARRPGQNVPTPARRPGQNVPTPARRPPQNVPTPAARRTAPRVLGDQVPTPSKGWSPSSPPARKEPTPVPEREETNSAEPTPTTLNKPVAQLPDELRVPALYSALVDAPPETRAKQLTLTLHWDRTLPEGIGEPVGLEDCLRNLSHGDRHGLIEAYWVACQRAAEYQVLVQQAQLLEDLVLVAGHERHPPALRLRSAGLATAAALHEAHADLLEAQFDLAIRIGRETDQAWPIPSTAPHCGRYVPKIAPTPGRLAESWRMRRLAAMIPGLGESLLQRAGAVVHADAARATAAASPPGGPPIEPVLACIGRETAQTFAFLRTLTAYNRAIAEYALTVLPPDAPPDELAALLAAEKRGHH